MKMKVFQFRLGKKALSFFMSVLILCLCVPSSLIASAVTQVTVSYINIDDSSDVVTSVITGSAVNLGVMVNNLQVDSYYDGDDKSTANRYLPKHSFPFTATQIANGLADIYVAYTDGATIYHNYGGDCNANYDALSNASATNNGTNFMSRIALNAPDKDKMNLVIMGGVTKTSGAESGYVYGKKDVNFGTAQGSDSYRKRTVITGAMNALPMSQLCKTPKTVLTGTYNGITYNSAINIGDATGAVSNREFYAPYDFEINGINIFISAAVKYKWFLLDNEEGHVTIGDDVKYYSSYNSGSGTEIKDFKTYSVVNLENGLTIRYVDEAGELLLENKISTIYSNTAPPATATGYINLNNVNGIYFKPTNPGFANATGYSINGVDYDINSELELPNTFTGTETQDTVEVVVKGDMHPVTATIDCDGEIENRIYIAKDSGDGAYYLQLFERYTKNNRQVFYYTVNGVDYFPYDKIPVTPGETLDITVHPVPAETVYLYHNYGGYGASNTNTGLSPANAISSFAAIYQKAIEYSDLGDKVYIVFMGGQNQTSLSNLRQYIGTDTTLSKSSTIGISASVDNTTTSGKSAFPSIKTSGGEYESAPNVVYTSYVSGINFNPTVTIASTDLALYNNITFEKLNLYYSSTNAPDTEVVYYKNGYNFYYSEINTNIIFKSENNASQDMVITYVNSADENDTYTETVLCENDSLEKSIIVPPTTINGQQVDSYEYNGHIYYPKEKISTLAVDTENASATVKFTVSDKHTYYISKNQNFGSDDNDGLSAMTPVLNYSKVISLCNSAGYDEDDDVRIVLMNTDFIGSLQLSNYRESGYTYTTQYTVVSSTITDDRADPMDSQGKNALGFTPSTYSSDLTAYKQATIPKIEITSKYHNIDFHSIFKLASPDMYLYNDLYIHDLTLYGITSTKIYAQGCNFHAGKGITTMVPLVSATVGYDAALESGISQGYPNLSVMGCTWGSSDRVSSRLPIRYNPTITIESGIWGRVMGGSRMGSTGVMYNPENKKLEPTDPYNATIDIKGTTDISLVCGGQTEAIYQGNSTINFGGTANIVNLVGGTLGYESTAYEYETTCNYINEYNGDIFINTTGTPTIQRLYGGCVGRKTTSIASFGTINININGGEIETLWGGAGAGDVYGNIDIVMHSGIVGKMFGGGSGKSPYTNKSSIKTGDYALTDMGSVLAYDDESGRVTITMTGDSILGDLFGGGDGYDYEDPRYTEVACVHGGTQVHISDNAVIEGSVYGGGNGYEYSEEIAHIEGVTDVTISNGGVVKGTVYGGGKNGLIEGNSSVHINDGIVYGSVFGGGEGAQVSNSTVILDNGAEVFGTVFGGGENGTVDGDTSVVLSQCTVNENVHGGGENGIVTQNTSLTINDGANILGDIFGGGCGATATVCTDCETDRDMLYYTNVTMNGGSVSGNVFGGGESGIVGVDYLDILGHIDDEDKSSLFFDKVSTNVTINSGLVKGSVYGGGKGSSEDKVHGNVFGKSNVNIYGGTIETNVFGGGDYGAIFADLGANNNRLPGNSKIDMTPDLFDIKIVVQARGTDITIGTGSSSNVSGNIYGGGYRNLTYGNVLITLTKSENRAGFRVKMDSVYGDGNISQVEGYKTIYADNFNSAPDDCAVYLKNGNDESFVRNCYKISSIQHADTLFIDSSNIQFLGDYDTTITNDSNKYALKTIANLFLYNSSTVYFHQKVKYVDGLYGDIDPTTDYITADSQTGTNDSMIYYPGAQGYNSNYLSSYQNGNFVGGDGKTYKADQFSTIILGDEVYFEIIKAGTSGTSPDDYGEVKGVFTLAVTTDQNNRTGGDYVAASLDSTGTFITLSDEEGCYGLNLDGDYLDISDSDRPIYNDSKTYHLWYARYSYTVTYYGDSYFVDDDETTLNGLNKEYSISSGVLEGGTAGLPSVSPVKDGYIFNEWYYFKYVGDGKGVYTKDSNGAYSNVGQGNGSYVREAFDEDVVISQLRSADIGDNTGELDHDNNLDVFPYFWPHTAKNMYYTSFSYTEPWTMDFYTRFRDPQSLTKPYVYLTSDQISEVTAFIYYGEKEPSYLQLIKKNTDGTYKYGVPCDDVSTVEAYDGTTKWLHCSLSNIKISDINKKAYVMFGMKYKGAEYFSAIKERTLSEILQQVITQNIAASNDEQNICGEMVGYFENLDSYKQSYSDDTQYVDATDISSSASGINSSTTYTAIDSSVVQYNSSVKLGENWGMNLSAYINDVDLNSSEVTDYGVVVYEDNGIRDENGNFVDYNYCDSQKHIDDNIQCSLPHMTVDDFLNDSSTVVYSKADNNISLTDKDGMTYMTATYVNRTYNYLMNRPVHISYYYVDSSGYHFTTPRVCSVYEEVIKVIDNTDYTVAQRELAQGMLSLFQAVYKYQFGKEFTE